MTFCPTTKACFRLSTTIIDEPVAFSQLWIRVSCLSYSLFVICSIATLIEVTRISFAILDTTALWTFLFGPILAGFAALDANSINGMTDVVFHIEVIKPWEWARTVLAFSLVTFWIYVARRTEYVSNYVELIEKAELEKESEEFEDAQRVSSAWYPAAVIIYVVGFYVSLFTLLGGFPITYVVLPWFFLYGPVIGVCVLFDSLKINSASKDRHLNDKFWFLFTWLFYFLGFWFYFLERGRAAVGDYKEDGRTPEAGRWGVKLYDLTKVKLHRLLFRMVHAAGKPGPRRRGPSRQRNSDRPKRPSLDSQIAWALGVFGLDSEASKALVRRRYHELMSDYHPDKLGQATGAQRRLVEDKAKEINRAHDLLERYFTGGTKYGEPTALQEVTRVIEQFTPSTIWNNEEGYQAELYSVLKQRFPDVSVDPRKDSTRPDILLRNIGIEVKGPTGAGELKILPDECLRYSPHYKHLIFVLFNPEFTELFYKEITEGIGRNYHNVRIIRKALSAGEQDFAKPTK